MNESDDAEVDLSGYAEVLLRRRWVFAGVCGLTLLASALYAFLARPVYEAATLVELEKPSYTRVMDPAGGYVDGEDEAYFETEYRLFKTDTLTQRVYDQLGLESESDFAPPRSLKKLQDAITISPVGQTRLAYVRVRCHDPRLAARVSAALAAAFVQDHVNDALFMSRDILQALQLDKAGVDKKRMYQSLPSVVDNRLIQSIKEQRVTAAAQLAELSARLTAKNPEVIAARGRVAALDRMLERETENIVRSLRVQLSGELLGNNVRIVDAARLPDAPVRPDRPLVLVLGLVVGVLAGLGAAAVVELLDQSIRSEEDVERKIREAFLGAVPLSRHEPRQRVYEPLIAAEASLTSEAFRNLRTMVDFAGAGGTATSLLVASSVKDEGKSFVSANLAVAFSQAGQRVLLIDGDLRRPTVHKKFHLSCERGVSDFLAGAVPLDALDGMLQTIDVENLKVLVCGPRPPNPSELLNTPRLSALIGWAARRFDRVIVDCPPLFPISDTLLWGRHVRSAVLVTRFGLTRAPLVSSARDRLKVGGVKALGVVINAARPNRLSYAGPYYEAYYHPN